MQRKEYLYSDLLAKGGSKEGLFSKEWSPEEFQLIKMSGKEVGLRCLGLVKPFAPSIVKNVASLAINKQYY